MSKVSNPNIAPEIAKPRVSEFRRITKVMWSRWVVKFGIIIVLVFLVVAIFAPLIAPYDPDEPNLNACLQKPSGTHLLGTDELGRDILSRIIYGSRISLLVGLVAVAAAGILGTGLGLIAGYFGGLINTFIMRFTDALLSFPPLVLMLGIAVALGGGLTSILIAIAIGMMPTYCRLACGQILACKEIDFVSAAYVIGASDLRIMFRHLLPNSFAPILVLMTINLGTAIMGEAALSFLGVGITPPTASWGSMINMGYRHLMTSPVLSFAPGVAIMLVVLSYNMVGDGLRDALDPRLRGTL